MVDLSPLIKPDVKAACRICRKGWHERVDVLLESARSKEAVVDLCEKNGLKVTRYLLDKHIAHRARERAVETTKVDVGEIVDLNLVGDPEEIDRAYEGFIRAGLKQNVGMPIEAKDLLRAMHDFSERQLKRGELKQNAMLTMMKNLRKQPTNGTERETEGGAGVTPGILDAATRPADEPRQAAAIVPELWGTPGAAR